MPRGQAADVLKYGVVWGTPIFGHKAPWLASDVVSKKSGRYCVYDISDGYWRASNNGENKISAYVEHDFTAGSSSGAEEYPVAQNVNAFCTELPYAIGGAAGTLTEALLATYLSLLMDLYVASNIQYADIQTNDNILRCWGGSVSHNTLFVTVVDSAIASIA
jgi:hypothetical protein